jgi:CHAT domain-containing protein
VVLDDRVLVWIIESGRVRRLTLPARRSDIDEAVDRFRLELRSGADEETIRQAAAPLYDILIRPLALPSSCKSLVVVPDRSLARLPFAALYDNRLGQYLIEQRAISITPSATLWLRSAEARPERSTKNISVLTVGVSASATYRGTFLPPLSSAEDEAADVARIYSQSSLLLGTDATPENFLRLSLSTDVVHFAGHAVVDPDAPRRSVLLFGDSSGTSLRPLSLGDLFDARAGSAELVVLSACRAQDSVANDREGLLGLAGAFVAAGVREVVASPLEVADELSPPVMATFHRHYVARRSAVVAFREAVLELLRRGGETSSPAAWGAFTVIEGFQKNGGPG